MHIYAFGSICRGEVNAGSDIDLLAIVDGRDNRFDIDTYSVYSYDRVKELWTEGNPFAWHLHLEAKPIFLSDDCDFIADLKEPSDYTNGIRDCEKFYSIFKDALNSVKSDTSSQTFDLSTIFLSIRNIATCFSLHYSDTPSFSRHSALMLNADSLSMPEDTYSVLERARILCTRGHGKYLTRQEINQTIQKLDIIEHWMQNLVFKVKGN